MSESKKPGLARATQAGTSLLEAVVVIALLGLVAGVYGLYLRPAETPLKSGTKLVEVLLKQARARAVSTTSVRQVRPVSSTSLLVETANSCSDSTWVVDPELALDLTNEVSLAETSWSVCFNRRGLASQNLTLTLNHPDRGSRQMEVLRGGVVRKLP